MSAQAFLADYGQSTSHSPTMKSAANEGRLWDPATNIASWTWGRDISYVFQVWKTALPIWASDMIAVGISISLSVCVFYLLGGVPDSLIWTHVACWCIALTAGSSMSGLYPATGLNSATELRRITRVISATVALCVAYDLCHGGDNRYLMLWPLYGLMMVGLTPLARAFFRRLVCRQDWWGFKTIVIGAGDTGMELLKRLNRNPSLGFKPVAMVDRYRSDWMVDDESMPVGGICSLEDTPKLSVRHHAYCGIFAGSEFPASERIEMIDKLTSVFPQLYITSDSAEAGRQWSGMLEMGNTRLLRVTENLLMPGARWIKRFIDITLVLMVAPVIVPLVFLLALIVKLTSPGPAFYRASRVGRNGSTIYLWKLRSMVPNADRLLKDYLAKNPELRADWERIHKLPNDPRVTTIGKFIRKTSLDEVPQLLNVLVGDMSLVGPRPIPHDQVAKYQHVYPLYLRVTPGITGLWQINGRSSTTHDERLSYDAEYVRNWSVCLDLYILARTVHTVVTCDGAC